MKLTSIGLFLFVAWFAYSYFSESPEEEIRSLFEQAQETAQIQSRLSPIETMERSKQVISLLAENIVIFWSHNGTPKNFHYKKTDIRKPLMAALSHFTTLEVDFRIKHIAVTDTTAQVKGILSAKGSLIGHEGVFFDQHETEVRLTEANGEWQFTSVEHRKNLRD